MGLITGLVSTVVHVAAGRNPYGHNHNQSGRPVVTTAGYAVADTSACGCTSGPGGEPCGICGVALPFGKGRQAKRERRAMRHAQKAQRFSDGRYPGYVPAYAAGGPRNGYQQQGVYRGVMPAGQAEGVEEARGRRASTGADVPPPAYEEGESSVVAARRSVEVLGDFKEKHTEDEA